MIQTVQNVNIVLLNLGIHKNVNMCLFFPYVSLKTFLVKELKQRKKLGFHFV
jgi:hypothetical protein